MRRADYPCQAWHHGVAPLDQELGLCPGGLSAGWEEGVAVLGVTQDAFEQAATGLAKLSLVTVCPHAVRAATEKRGAWVVADEEAQVAAPAPVAPAAHRAARAALHCNGWGLGQWPPRTLEGDQVGRR
ncbi:MAG: hypothetical protein M5U01_41055 [Ardenticatenaceae bacterium]|nr:hypothetical protein [Ardenticatenaceae bacterium]